MWISNTQHLLAEVATSENWGIKLIVGLVGGVVATFVGFVLNQSHQNSKDRIKKLEEYIVALQSTANELEFYAAKLQQLSSQLQSVIASLNLGNVQYIVPTYSLYPGFLENCKSAISSFHKSPKLVKEIGHCHFELCHVLERLNLLKKETEAAWPTCQNEKIHRLKHELHNATGFKGLVDANIPVFQAALAEALSETRRMETELQDQRDRSVVRIPD